jgi:hypothetical protein
MGIGLLYEGSAHALTMKILLVIMTISQQGSLSFLLLILYQVDLFFSQ